MHHASKLKITLAFSLSGKSSICLLVSPCDGKVELRLPSGTVDTEVGVGQQLLAHCLLRVVYKRQLLHRLLISLCCLEYFIFCMLEMRITFIGSFNYGIYGLAVLVV